MNGCITPAGSLSRVGMSYFPGFFCSGTDIIHTRGGVHAIIGSVSFPPLSIDCCPATDTFDTNKIFMDIFYARNVSP